MKCFGVSSVAQPAVMRTKERVIGMGQFGHPSVLMRGIVAI